MKCKFVCFFFSFFWIFSLAACLVFFFNYIICRNIITIMFRQYHDIRHIGLGTKTHWNNISQETAAVPQKSSCDHITDQRLRWSIGATWCRYYYWYDISTSVKRVVFIRTHNTQTCERSTFSAVTQLEDPLASQQELTLNCGGGRRSSAGSVAPRRGRWISQTAGERGELFSSPSVSPRKPESGSSWQSPPPVPPSSDLRSAVTASQWLSGPWMLHSGLHHFQMNHSLKAFITWKGSSSCAANFFVNIFFRSTPKGTLVSSTSPPHNARRGLNQPIWWADILIRWRKCPECSTTCCLLTFSFREPSGLTEMFTDLQSEDTVTVFIDYKPISIFTYLFYLAVCPKKFQN